MLYSIWNAILYKPLVNVLAFLVAIIPGGDVGIAIIILTILVKIALYPLSKKSLEGQARMNLITPELNKIKESGLSKEEQARQTFALYKKYKANPFSGCLLVLIQIPIIFALYYVFLKGLHLETSMFYSFVKVPENISTQFLGLVDISQKNWLLAILAGISQFFQAFYAPKPPKSNAKEGSFQESLNKSMQMQMKYVFPFIVVFIAHSISGAVALYWITNNVFTTFQQIYINKKNKDLVLEVKD